MDYELLRDRFKQALRGTLKGDDDAHEVIVDELISIVEELYKQHHPLRVVTRDASGCR
jgi:hypothetical protein